MWQLITQTQTELPPQPTRLRLPETAGASEEDSETWTYGGMVQNQEFDHYDSQLKYLVMWCLGKTSSQDRIRSETHCPGAVGCVELTDG